MAHVLLVEDRPIDRELIREALEQRGAQVTVAANDAEAYALLRDRALDGVDVLLTDINLGLGTTGFDVARAARSERPDLPVVYMSGFSIRTDGHLVEDSLFLKKPLQLSELAEPVLALCRSEDRSWESSNDA